MHVRRLASKYRSPPTACLAEKGNKDTAVETRRCSCRVYVKLGLFAKIEDGGSDEKWMKDPNATFWWTSGSPRGDFFKFFLYFFFASCLRVDCRALWWVKTLRPAANLCCLLQQVSSRVISPLKAKPQRYWGGEGGVQATRSGSSYQLLHMLNPGSMHRLCASVCVCVHECVSASALKSTVKTECTEMFFSQTVHTFGMLIYISSLFGAWGPHRELNKGLLKGFSFLFCFKYQLSEAESF